MSTITGTEGNDSLASPGWASTLEGLGGDDTLTSSSRLFDVTPDALYGGTGNDTYVVPFPVVYPIYSTPIIWAYFEGNAEVHEAISTTDLQDRLVLNEGFATTWLSIRFDGDDLLVTGFLGLTQLVRVVDAYGVDATGRLASGLDILQAATLPPITLTEQNTWLPFLLAGTSAGDTLDAGAATQPRVLDGRDGDDLLLGGAGRDLLAGGAGDDSIAAGAGDDRAFGGDGADSITGGAGADALHGMAGDDSLAGGADGDTYHHGNGEGLDRIADVGGTTDRIRFADALLADLIIAREGSDLRITRSADPADGVLVLGQFGGTGGRIETLELADGTTFDLAATANAAPVALLDSVIAVAGRATSGNVLADNGAGADADPDGDTLSVLAGRFTTDAGGKLIIAADGGFTYRPLTGFLGGDGVAYTLRDALGAETTGRIEFTVGPNVAPVTRKDSFATAEDMPLTGNLLADNGFGADSDGNGDALTVRAGSFATALGGRVTITADGGFSYAPPAEASGADSFTYRVSDGFGGTARGRVDIAVTPVPDAPIARDDAFAGSATGLITGDLLANNGRGADSDADGDALSVQAARFLTARGGWVEIAADGSFTYRNLDGQTGPDSFAYTLRDATGRTDAGLVTLTLSAPAGAILGTAGENDMRGTTGDDLVLGLGADDRIAAGDGGDTVHGGAGNDRIEAARGNDLLVGGTGNDRLEGEAGADTLIGGPGADDLDGGDGADRFLFAHPGEGADIVRDFKPAEGDVLDLSGLLADVADPLAAVRITTSAQHALLEADTGDGFVLVATLMGGAGLPGPGALAASGHLIVA